MGQVNSVQVNQSVPVPVNVNRYRVEPKLNTICSVLRNIRCYNRYTRRYAD